MSEIQIQNQNFSKLVVRFLCATTHDCLHELLTQESLFKCCVGEILGYFLLSSIYSNMILNYVATVLIKLKFVLVNNIYFGSKPLNVSCLTRNRAIIRKGTKQPVQIRYSAFYLIIWNKKDRVKNHVGYKYKFGKKVDTCTLIIQKII